MTYNSRFAYRKKRNSFGHLLSSLLLIAFFAFLATIQLLPGFDLVLSPTYALRLSTGLALLAMSYFFYEKFYYDLYVEWGVALITIIYVTIAAMCLPILFLSPESVSPDNKAYTLQTVEFWSDWIWICSKLLIFFLLGLCVHMWKISQQ